MSELPIPSITLNDGHEIPQLGLGTYLLTGEECERVVSEALQLGYRHLDTARVYRNEAEVGGAVRESGIARDELFITTKLWNDDQLRAHEAFDASLERLGLDRVDLYLIHWPQAMFGEAPTAWRSLIEIAESGRATSIGVCNFEISDLERLAAETGVVPAVNQIEVHPLHLRSELRDYCAEHGIAVEAWGPLSQGKSDLLERPAVVRAAEAHGRTPAQTVLRWHVQHGHIVFPKTSSRERLIENAALFDFELTAAEMAAIDALDEGRNFGPDPRTYDQR